MAAVISPILSHSDVLSEPESASPLFNHFDKQGGQDQKEWHRKFIRSLYALSAIAFLSTILGISGWLKSFEWSDTVRDWFSDENIRWFDVAIIITTIATVGLELFYQKKLRRQRNSWTIARGKAESIRSLVWFYLFELHVPSAIIGSHSAHIDDAGWQRMMRDKAEEIEDAIAASATEPIQALIDLRFQVQQLSPEEKLLYYIEHRIDNQKKYFSNQANKHKKRSQKFRRRINWLLGGAIVWGVMRIIFTLANSEGIILFFNSLNLFPFLITLVALFKAYTESEDIEPLSERYLQMANRIVEYKKITLPISVTSVSFEQFVRESEIMLHEETAEWATRHREAPVRSVTIGFVGKRRLPNEKALRVTLESLLDKLEHESLDHNFMCISSLAMGADIIFAETVVLRSTNLFATHSKYGQQILLPAPAVEFFLPSDFRLAEHEPFSAVNERLARAYACLNSPTVDGRIRVASSHNDRDERFAETAVTIVDESKILVVACTQDEKVTALDRSSKAEFLRGGSAETLCYAHEQGKRVFIIEVDAPINANGQLPTSELAEA